MSRLFVVCASLLVACGGAGPSPRPPASEPSPREAALPPAPVAAKEVAPSASRGAVQIDCGDFHTCATMADSTVRCWGRNDHGQLGDGTTEDRPSPVSLASVSGAVEIAAGTTFTCARLAGGTLSCWGSGLMLGDGAERKNAPPTAVPRVTGVLDVRAAGLVTCARHASGARCWGLASDRARRATEVDVAELGRPVELAVGAAHACGRDAGGGVACWGDFEWALGARSAMLKPPVAGLSQFATGDDFMCGVTKAGTVQCWGRNDDGQLGSAPDEDVHAKPVEIPGVRGAVRVAAGEGQACAVLGDGTVRCWGANEEGELGLGTRTTTELAKPAVTGLAGVRELCIGSSHACARTSDGGVHCWGANAAGQLGDGTRERRLSPVRVQGI